MSSVLVTAARVVNSTGAPMAVIGTKEGTYADLQVLGAVIAVGMITVIALVRRYLAARQAGWSTGVSIGFAVRIWSRAAHGGVSVPRGLLTGADYRVSTSKTAAALWTVVLTYFIASMALIFGGQPGTYNALIQSFSPLYLVLLGGPLAAAVLAKSMVSGAVAARQLQKGKGTSRAIDVFSDDDGSTDLIDTQYIAFNVLVAVIVIIQFASHPGFGAPAVPGFLAALSGTSAAVYVVNKALTVGNPPSITQMSPSQVRPEAQVILHGQNFLVPGDDPDDMEVTVAGQPALLDGGNPAANQLTFRVPANAVTGAVVVTTPSGLSTAAVGGANGSPTLTVIPDSIQVTGIDSSSVMPGGTLTLFGSGFFNAADVTWQGSALANRGPGTRGLLTQQDPPLVQHPHTFDCPLADAGSVPSDAQLTLIVPVSTPPGSYKLTLLRGALSCDPQMVVQILPL